MSKYRKKPVVIEAVQWLADKSSRMKLSELANERIYNLSNGNPFELFVEDQRNGDLSIKTPKGRMVASLGDWIIRGVQGEFYPCKPDIFEQTYEAAGSEVAG